MRKTSEIFILVQTYCDHMFDGKNANIMVWNKQISLPIILENQYLESLPSLSSKQSCWRIFLRWKYCIPNKEILFVQLLQHLILLCAILCVMLLALSSNNSAIKHTGYNKQTVIYFKKTEELRGTEQSVYNQIGKWQLNTINNDIHKLPILSSLRDASWLNYEKNEVFRWEEPHLDFVHDILKNVDSDNGTSYNDTQRTV